MRPLNHSPLGAALILAFLPLGSRSTVLAATGAEEQFERQVRPILSEHCFGCHADGANEGSMSFDDLLAMEDHEAANERWHHVLKQLQAGTMPPTDEPRPSEEQLEIVESWIKYGAFGLDPADPDPGHVTMRRLNQVEYRNTIRDLLGVDYDTAGNFPADDTGHGFDNIGDVLSLSPLMLEKYVNAAKEIVSSVVPVVSGVVRKQSLPGEQFQLDLVSVASSIGEPDDGDEDGGRRLPNPGRSSCPITTNRSPARSWQSKTQASTRCV